MVESVNRRWEWMTTVEAEALSQSDPVVILPLGAIEQHGPHLPLSTDLEIGTGILECALGLLPADFPTWVLPPQAVGCSGEHERFPGTLSTEPHLLSGVLCALGAAVARSGAKRVVISNSHGGNVSAVDSAALELRRKHGLLVTKSHYFLFPRPEGVELPESEWRHGLHGGAIETALMLHLRPDLVRRSLAQDTPSLGQRLERSLRHVSPAAAGASFAWMAEDLSASGVTGNATLATVALGQRLLDGYGRMLADVILDTRDFPIETLT